MIAFLLALFGMTADGQEQRCPHMNLKCPKCKGVWSKPPLESPTGRYVCPTCSRESGVAPGKTEGFPLEIAEMLGFVLEPTLAPGMSGQEPPAVKAKPRKVEKAAEDFAEAYALLIEDRVNRERQEYRERKEGRRG